MNRSCLFVHDFNQFIWYVLHGGKINVESQDWRWREKIYENCTNLDICLFGKKYPSLDASGGRSKFILYYIEENLNVLFLNHQNTETKIVKEIKLVQ